MRTLLITLLFVSLFIVGCSSTSLYSAPYQNVLLQDVRTQSVFTLDQFHDKPILLQVFSLSNPESTWQQHEFKKLQNRVGDKVILISVDIDPKDTLSQVQNHFTSIGFNWRLVYASNEFRDTLVDQFNVSVLNSPKSPVILVCPNSEGILLEDGLKESWRLAELIDGC